MSPETSPPWRSIDDAATLADRLVRLYETQGDGRYDEAVSQTEHAVQAALHARDAGAADALVAAALLHDVGHLLLNEHDEGSAFRERDLRHEEVAARFLASWFGDDVTEPIRHHVAAKRYLCMADPGYHATLSPASVRSLELQGGPMDAAEAAAFEADPGAAAATDLRRWDDLAKDPDRAIPEIRTFAPLLESLARLGGRGRTPTDDLEGATSYDHLA